MITTLQGDCRAVLPALPEKSVQMCVTSPPYYGLRRYTSDPREIGQEPIPDCLAWARGEPPGDRCYVCALRAVFAGVWRVLRDDGLLFLNLGDSYVNNEYGRHDDGRTNDPSCGKNAKWQVQQPRSERRRTLEYDLPQKNLLGIPWRTALALQADGWVLRNDNIWAKINPMPESVQDRCTRAHEYVFMLAKGPRYYYDAAAVAEPAVRPGDTQTFGGRKGTEYTPAPDDPNFRNGSEQWGRTVTSGVIRNRRTVWTISTRPHASAHYATFPEALVEIPIRAGSSAQACEHCGAAWRRVVERETNWQDRKANGACGDNRKPGLVEDKVVHGNGMSHDLGTKMVHDLGLTPGCTCENNTGSAASTVLDPFMGSGTVARVAERLGRNAIGIELSESYIADHIEKRTNGVQKEMFV